MKEYLMNAVDLEIEHLEKLKCRLVRRKKELEYLPSGNLVANVSRGRVQYYLAQFNGGKESRRYLGMKDEILRKDLQERHFIEKAMRNCEKDLEMLRLLRDSYYPMDPDEIVKNDALAYREQTNANEMVYGVGNSERWRQRKLAIKNRYPLYKPDGLKHTAIDGTLTRTKSEALILNLLVEKEIAFVYEVPMRLGDKLMLPDFLLYDRKHGREIILEHMGRMDVESYRDDQYDKLGLYIRCGYVPNVNLILTFEDADGNINAPAINRVIDAVIQ